MKVCFLCNEYPEGPIGGVGTITKLLAEELITLGHQVKVIGVYNYSYPSPDYEIKNDVNVYRIKVNHTSRFSVIFGYLKMIRIINRWVAEGAVDIIESPDSYGIISVFRSFRVPFILRANGNNTYFNSVLGTPLRKRTKWYEKNLYRRADAICAVSEFTAKKMKQLYDIDENITVIYNGIDVDYANDILLNDDVLKELSSIQNPIIFSGTLTMKKGIYELVRAILLLLRRNVKVTLIINGKDFTDPLTGKSVKQDLLDLIPLEFQKYFIFKGHVSREILFQQYKLCKAAVFPSHAEAFAMAPLEAMSIGVITLFSNKCSGNEAIEHLVDGLLFNPDKEEIIAEAIEWVLQHPEQAEIIGLQGKQKVEKCFSKQLMAENSIIFYENAINNYYKKKNK